MDEKGSLWATGATSAPLTRELIEQAFAKLEAERLTPDPGQLAAVEFIRATPEHLHSHPTITTIYTVLLYGQPIHPNEKARLKAAYERLLNG